MPELIVDLSEAKKFLSERKSKCAIVQIPEGLKDRATWILDELAGCSENIFVKMDPNYGACDLPLWDMRVLNADSVVHIGHGPIHRHKDIIYMPCHYSLSERDIEENAERLLKELKKRKIGSIALVANAQNQQSLPEFRKRLFESGINCFVGQGTSRIASEGQVLGCNYSVVEEAQPSVDASVYLGDGYFHPLGLLYSTKKPVIAVNPLHNTVEEISEKTRDRQMRKRFAAIAKASEAQSFGIIVSVKSGQRQKEKALSLKKAIEECGKKAYLFGMDLVNESYMAGVKVDCLVNTACNRIVLDDAENWKALIINPTECLIAIGKKKWEEWQPDEFEH